MSGGRWLLPRPVAARRSERALAAVLADAGGRCGDLWAWSVLRDAERSGRNDPRIVAALDRIVGELVPRAAQ